MCRRLTSLPKSQGLISGNRHLTAIVGHLKASGLHSISQSKVPSSVEWHRVPSVTLTSRITAKKHARSSAHNGSILHGTQMIQLASTIPYGPTTLVIPFGLTELA